MHPAILTASLTLASVGAPAWCAAAETAPPAPLRIGVVGYEGHGSVFVNELNAGLGQAIGLTVSHVWHREAIDEAVRRKYGFEVVARPQDLIGKVDGVFIAEELPHRYRELAEPFIRAGVRTFLNRPLAGSAADAAALLRLARECRNPILAASLLAVDPGVLAARAERDQFGPLKVVNVTGPSDHFWWYVPHAISILVAVLGPGVEEVQAHDFAWGQEGVSVRQPLVVFFRYAADSAVGPVRGTLQIVTPTQPDDWYGFRLKLYGHRESPEYTLMKGTPGESPWLPVYRTMIAFYRDGQVPIPERELLEVPLVLDMIRRSGTARRAVTRSEYAADLAGF